MKTLNVEHIAPNQIRVKTLDGVYFQSYDSVIVKIDNNGNTILDKKYYKFSKTTIKYRNHFLGETTKEIENK